MKILIAYFSKTGNTKNLTYALQKELIARGNSVELEVIRQSKNRSWLVELLVEILFYPSIGLALINKRWRNYHINTYHQIEEAIQPLSNPDISGFDRVCIGGPKWAHISYPVARYIKIVQGLDGKKIGAFTTFGGPPLKVLELELISSSMKRALKVKNVTVSSEVYLSSNYHQVFGLLTILKLLSRIIFRRPIKDFILGTEYANEKIKKFCDEII